MLAFHLLAIVRREADIHDRCGTTPAFSASIFPFGGRARLDDVHLLDDANGVFSQKGQRKLLQAKRA